VFVESVEGGDLIWFFLHNPFINSSLRSFNGFWLLDLASCRR